MNKEEDASSGVIASRSEAIQRFCDARSFWIVSLRLAMAEYYVLVTMNIGLYHPLHFSLFCL